MPDVAADLHPLTRYRQRHSLTQINFAKLASTTAATLSRIETGKRQPAVTLLRQLVTATQGEVSADEIINFRFYDQAAAMPPRGEATINHHHRAPRKGARV